MGKHRVSAASKNGINGSQNMIEIHKDDSVLPDAEEIKRLHEIDPNILEFLKTHATKEQDFRHKMEHGKLDIIRDEAKSIARGRTISRLLAFTIMLGGMWISYNLLMTDKDVLGSIFGGGTLILAASLFLPKQNSTQKGK